MTIIPFPVCAYAAIHYKMEDDCTSRLPFFKWIAAYAQTGNGII